MSAPGKTSRSFPISCTASGCLSAIALPAGTWTFDIALRGANADQGVLSEGSMAQELVSGSPVHIAASFSKMVASVILRVNPFPFRKKQTVGTASSGVVTLTPLDASGAIIVSPGQFETPSGVVAPIILSFANTVSPTIGNFSFTTGSPPTSSVSFAQAHSLLPSTIYYNGGPVNLQFPVLAVTQNGANVPLDASSNQPWLPVTPPAPTSTMTSNGCCLSHNSIVYNATSPSPLIYWCNNNDSPPCYVNNGSNNVAINTSTAPVGYGLTAFDGAFNLWFYDSISGGSQDLGYGTPGLAFSFPVCGPLPALNRMSTGTDGNVWYALSPSGAVPSVGYVSTSSCPSPVPVGTSNSTTITGLVGGPSSQTYLTVSNASQTQLWVTTSSLSPSLVNSSSIIPFVVTAIGYAPFDSSSLYVQSATGAIYALSRSTGLVAPTPLCTSAPSLTDTHGLFSQLPDGTLAYEAPDQNGDPIVTRIMPGAGCFSFTAGITNGYSYNLFAISKDGSHITVSNGGNIAHIAF